MNFVFWAKIKHDANFDAKHDDWLQRRIWALSKYVTTCSCLSSKEAVSHAVVYKIRTSIRPYTWSTTKILTCDLFAVANFFSVSWIESEKECTMEIRARLGERMVLTHLSMFWFYRRKRTAGHRKYLRPRMSWLDNVKEWTGLLVAVEENTCDR